jgi:hypothetical protein
MRPKSSLSFHMMTLALILFINLNIIGIILIGYIASLENHGPFTRLVTMLVVTGIAATYLALRLKTHPERLSSKDAFPVYFLGMVISAILPLVAYLIFDLSLINLRVAPLFFAQSVFMITVLGIKMHTSRHYF